MKHLLRLLMFLWLSSVQAATLLPMAEQQFFDDAGAPLAGGWVYFYVPATTTLKTTWQDANGSVANSNPVHLDGAGRAIIYGAGQYRQKVTDSLGTLIWDQLTSDTAGSSINVAGTSTGSANAQAVTVPNFSFGDGQLIEFMAGFTNSGVLSLNPNASGPVAVKKDSSSGPMNTSGGEVVVGNRIVVSYSTSDGVFHLLAVPQVPNLGTLTNLASSATTDLGSIASHNVNITGGTNISSFGGSCVTTDPIYKVVFAGTLTLTYNAVSMILPGAQDIVVSAGDTLEAMCLGGSNWKILSFTHAEIAPSIFLCQPQKTIYSNGAGSSGTYTTPTCQTLRAKYLDVEFVAGGGGGGGASTSANNAGNGGTGGTSSFGTALYSATGGSGGAASSTVANSEGGAGGVGSGCTENLSGSQGGSSFVNSLTPFSSLGGHAVKWGLGGTGSAQSAAHGGLYGGGGSGGSGNGTTVVIGAGGGGGGYCSGTITTPNASYAYVQGAGGTAGTAGTSGTAGGAGGIGYIVVIARWY